VLSGRGLCDEPIIRPEESYRLWCVVVCDLETSRLRRPWPAMGRSAIERKTYKKRHNAWGMDWRTDVLCEVRDFFAQAPEGFWCPATFLFTLFSEGKTAGAWSYVSPPSSLETENCPHSCLNSVALS